MQGQLLIMHEKGSATEITLNTYIQNNNISVIVPLELSSNRSIKIAVEGGIGIALISRRIANSEIQTGRLVAVQLSDQSMRHKYYMVHHKDKYISGMLQQLIETTDHWASEYVQSLCDLV